MEVSQGQLQCLSLGEEAPGEGVEEMEEDQKGRERSFGGLEDKPKDLVKQFFLGQYCTWPLLILVWELLLMQNVPHEVIDFSSFRNRIFYPTTDVTKNWKIYIYVFWRINIWKI